MPILEIEVKRKNRVGKFGSSYIDLYDINVDKLKIPFAKKPASPLLQDEPLVCRPNLTKSENRPHFAIERGNIPQFNCDVPSALQQEVDFLLGNGKENPDVDPFITESESLFQDITKSSFLGEQQGVPSDKTINGLGAVAGMSFSLFENSEETGRPLDFKPLRKPEIYWAFGLTQQKRAELWGCEQSGPDITPPNLITDTRNQHGINLANLNRNGGTNFQYHYSWTPNRFFLEVRHGLNTLKYATQVQMTCANGGDGGFQQIQHKNSFILTKNSSRRSGGGFFGHFNNPFSTESSIIPRGRITVLFLADPCDVSEYLGPDGELF
tara:strand:+ start:2761 stop:3732 length:972 start_codon:yes stop_codon:yes gene_type:complete